jgi:citrate lyase subunit beta/citryl-CoA lyase
MSLRGARSLLFVPGDSERKQARALASAADALILDLEDSVDPPQLPAARAQVAAVLGTPPRAGQQRWVRVNGPASGQLLPDLAAVAGTGSHALDGIVVPKVSGSCEIIAVAHYLEALEVAAGRALGSIRMIIIATETPQGVLAAPRYRDELGATVRTRIEGLTWGIEDLGTALGVRARRDAGGTLTFPFQLARATCLLAAASLEARAIDGVYAHFRDAQGLAAELALAVRDGFVAKLAIHPDQIEPINAAFTPGAAEIEHARAVLAAFAGGGAGVVSLDGQMLDRPHLLAAQRVLALAGEDVPGDASAPPPASAR